MPRSAGRPGHRPAAGLRASGGPSSCAGSRSAPTTAAAVRPLGHAHVGHPGRVEQLGEQRRPGDPADQQHRRRPPRTGAVRDRPDGRRRPPPAAGPARQRSASAPRSTGGTPPRTTGSSDSSSRTARDLGPVRRIPAARAEQLGRDVVEDRAAHRDPARHRDPAARRRARLGAGVPGVDDHERPPAPAPSATAWCRRSVPTQPSAATAAGTTRTAAATVGGTAGGGPGAVHDEQFLRGPVEQRRQPGRSTPGGSPPRTGSSASSRGRGSSTATRTHARPGCTATRFTGAGPVAAARSRPARGGSQASWTRRGRRAAGRRACARPGGSGLRPDGADQRALVRAAVHHQPRGGELPQPAEQRVEQRPARPAAAPGDDHVQPDVLGLRQELHERQQRVDRRATRGGDEVVVVDEHDDLRAAPPAALAQLPRPDGPARAAAPAATPRCRGPPPPRRRPCSRRRAGATAGTAPSSPRR